MSYTRDQWARAFLTAIGNLNPSPTAVNWVVAWSQFETSCCGGAAYNLLNTTEPNTPGVVSNFNSVGVKNYDSFANGIQANAKVLMNGLYNPLLQALRSNDTIALCNPGGGIQSSLGTWGTGGGAAANIASAACSGTVRSNDTFSGTATNVSTTNTSGNASTGGCPDCSQYNPLDPTQAPAWAGCVAVQLTCKGSAAANAISAGSAFFALLGPWLSNPTRLLKLILGVVGVGIGIFALFWPHVEDVAVSTVKQAGKAGLLA